MFRTGFIQSFRVDLVCFFTLPIVAVAIAMATQRWLTIAAGVSFALWITIPHQYFTWVRCYGLAEDRTRWKKQFIWGPLLIAAVVLALRSAPVTLLLFVLLWDHQHSLMQQHGLARIYDFKAKTGAPSTGRYDLLLNCVLFGNMLLTTPFFVSTWLRELYRLQIPISADTISLLSYSSWSLTGLYLCIYAGHVVQSVRQGYALNPYKYLFIASSYFLWYYCGWHTASALVWAIAHRIMHGVQYMVIVYLYIRRKSQTTQESHSVASFLVKPSHIPALIATALLYALAYEILFAHSLTEFGFGVVTVMQDYDLNYSEGYELFAASAVSIPALVHYYYDSFIWKVRDTQTQSGL